MAAGDPAAIEAFYREYFDPMYQEARRCSGGDEATCLDLVHDAMLKSLRSMRPIESAEELIAWTRRLVRSVTIDHFRSMSRRLKRELRTARSECVEERQAAYELAEARIVWLEEMISEMEEPSAQLIRLRYFRGWTLQRIGEALGLKPGAVDGRIRRLVVQLQQQAGDVE